MGMEIDFVNTTFVVNATFSDWMRPYSNSTLFSTNDSTAFPTTASPRSTAAVVGVATIMGLLAVVGTTLNGTVIFAVGFNKRLRTATSWFIVNLAAGDLMETTVYLPFGVYTVITHRVPFHPGLCAALATIGISNKFTSLSCMALIAFHRYMLITKPRSTYNAVFTTRNNVLIVLLAWLVSWTAAIPFVLGFGFLGMLSIGVCVAGTGPAFATRAVIGTLYALPLLTMLYSYTAIYRHIRNASYNPNNPSIQNQQKKNMLKVSKNLAVLACVFCVLVGPSCVFLASGMDWPSPVSTIVWIMYYANCCVNSYLHIRKNSDFKKTCRRMLSCISPQRQQNEDHPGQAGHRSSMGRRAEVNPERPSAPKPFTPEPLIVNICFEPREPCNLPTVSD
ncbi:neuropeptides B/W receptor type 1-like [Branchiostoma floridae]|uniref:Neuropeptides B/W receptor type 1-like n=1 Tax=Branchiostoma floridae TaxID=7739 RepID=A0A9J7HTC0_BRAFL|nr:neuropeptides B/W receptor type 1-like [Branchiostoma floridae]